MEQQLPKQMSLGLWYVGALKTLEASRFIFFLIKMIRTDEVISKTFSLSSYGFLAQGTEGRVSAQVGAVVVSNCFCLNMIRICKIKYMRTKTSSWLAILKFTIFLHLILFKKQIHNLL